MAYNIYPAVDPTYNFPPQVRAALAASTELRNTVIPMTTTLRNNLTAGEKWDGRVILNTTTDRLERWDAGLAGWQQVADMLDLVPYTNALLQRPGRNRIINGDFAVNQRGFLTTSTTGTFGMDRWLIELADGTVTHTPQSPTLGDLPESPMRVARVVTTGQTLTTAKAQLSQKIESVRTLSGKTVTVSFWAKSASGTPKVAVEFEQNFGSGAGSSSPVYVYAGQVTLSTTWTRHSLTVSVPSIASKVIGSMGGYADTDYLRLNLWTSAGSSFNSRTGSLGIQSTTIDIWGVQAEEGSLATPFEQESFVANLNKCQRYFYRIPLGNGDQLLASGIALTIKTAMMILPLPVLLRRPPVDNSAIDFAVWSTAIHSPIAATTYTCESVVARAGHSIHPNALSLDCAMYGTGLLTVGSPVFLMMGGSGMGFSVSAEF